MGRHVEAFHIVENGKGGLACITPFLPHPYALQIRSLAIQSLNTLGLSPLERIILARKHRIPRWLSDGATSLAATANTFNVEEVVGALGWEATARIYAIQTAAQAEALIKENKRNVAKSERLWLKMGRKGSATLKHVEKVRTPSELTMDAHGHALATAVLQLFESEVTAMES